MTAIESAPDRRLTVTPLLAPKRQESPLQEFARSAAYSAIQSPIKAIAQPIDRAFGTSLETNTTFINPAQDADFNTTAYWSQQAGHAVGMLGTFWVASKLVRGSMRGALTEEQLATRLGERGLMGLTLKEAAVTGFVHDSLLRPTDSRDTRSFIGSRLGSGINGALTMTALTGAGMGLKGIGLKNDAVNGLISGLGAGFVSAHTDSLLRTGNFASSKDVGKSMVTMSVLGGAFGTYHQIKGQHESGRSNFDWSPGRKSELPEGAREYKVRGGEPALNDALTSIGKGEPATLKVQEHLGPATGLKGWLGFQRYGPEQSLLLQHGPKADGSLAAKVDLVASCELPPSLKTKSVVDSTYIYLRAGQNRISFDVQPQPIRPGERAPTLLSKPGEVSPISKAITELADKYDTDRQFRANNEDLQYHDLPAYAKALRKNKVGYEPVEFIGAGFESVGFLLADGTVLKITRTSELHGGQWNESWGQRTFDAKIHGGVKILQIDRGGEIAVYRQPRVEMGSVDMQSAAYKSFMRKVRASGEEFWDSDYAGDQVGVLLDAKGEYVLRPIKGKGGKILEDEDGYPRMGPVIVLVDYPSVALPGEHP